MIDIAQSRNNLKIDIMSESFPHLEGGAIADFKSVMIDRGYWQDNNWNETKHFYTFETGTVIRFISVDTLGKAHGPRRDILFINECNWIPFEIYQQLELRTKYVIWLDWNPVSEFWYYTEIKDRVDHDFLILTYLDNEALDHNIRQSIEAKKNNRNFWKVYGLGELGDSEGKIYKDWQIIDEIPHEARLERRGLDFGYSQDPTAIVDIYKYNGGFILDEVCYQKGLSNKQISDIIKNLEPTLTIADSAEPKSIDEIKTYGITVIPAIKGKGSVHQGISYVQGQRISITKRSTNGIKEYRNYLWEKDKNGKILDVPIDLFNHFLDAARYGLSRYIETTKKSYIQPPHEPLSDYEYNGQVKQLQPNNYLDFNDRDELGKF